MFILIKNYGSENFMSTELIGVYDTLRDAQDSMSAVASAKAIEWFGDDALEEGVENYLKFTGLTAQIADGDMWDFESYCTWHIFDSDNPRRFIY